MSVKRAHREIDSDEFAEWMAFSKVEPFGAEAEDRRFAVLATILANVNRDPKSKPEPFTEADFFPTFMTLRQRLEKVVQGPTEDVLQSKLTAWATLMASQAKPKSELRARER